MGILDETQFDPGTYGGTPPGWLGALLRPQSGPDFAPDPAQLPPTFAPMSGGAVLPQAADRMGKDSVTPPQSGADGFGKDPGASNPFTDFLASLGSGFGNALLPSAAAAKAGPQGAPQAASNLFDRLSAGASNLTSGGNPIAGVLNSVRGLATGERTDAAGVRQANLMATFNALVGAGVAPPFAQVAALNPEILKTILGAHVRTNPAFQRTGTPSAGAPDSPTPQPSPPGRADLEAEARRRGLIP